MEATRTLSGGAGPGAMSSSPQPRLPPSLAKWKWPVDKIQEKIWQKVYERTAKSQDQIRRAFQMFDSINNGITLPVLQDRIQRKFGIVLSQEDAEELFRRFDQEGTGTIDFYEFISGVLERDYTRRPWCAVRAEQAEQRDRLRQGGKRVQPDRQKNFVSEHNIMASPPTYVDWHRAHPNRRAFAQSTKLKSAPGPVDGASDSGAALRVHGRSATTRGRPPGLPTQAHSANAEVEDGGLSVVLGEKWDMQGMWCDPPALGCIEAAPTALPESLQRWHWDVRRLEQAVAERVLSHTSKSGDQFRQIFVLFDRTNQGIDKHTFKEQLRKKFLILITDEQVDAIFQKHDPKGTGKISFHDFVNSIMPKDYTAEPWYAKLARERRAQRLRHARAGTKQAHHTEEIPATLKHWRPSLERLEDMIRDKVIQRTRGAQDQFRQMLCLFDRCNGAMTKEALRSMLARKLDVVMTDEEAEQLFMKHDKTGSGTISFYQFIRSIMPRDYPTLPDESLAPDAAAPAPTAAAATGRPTEPPVRSAAPSGARLLPPTLPAATRRGAQASVPITPVSTRTSRRARRGDRRSGTAAATRTSSTGPDPAAPVLAAIPQQWSSPPAADLASFSCNKTVSYIPGLSSPSMLQRGMPSGRDSARADAHRSLPTLPAPHAAATRTERFAEGAAARDDVLARLGRLEAELQGQEQGQSATLRDVQRLQRKLTARSRATASARSSLPPPSSH